MSSLVFTYLFLALYFFTSVIHQITRLYSVFMMSECDCTRKLYRDDYSGF